MKRQIIRREEDRLVVEGASLHWRRWIPGEPTRVVLFVHGMTEHSGRYDASAAWWSTHDAVVHAYDHRGHGHSDALSAPREAVSVWAGDLRRVVERVAKDAGDLPLLLWGHSLGALVSLRALAAGGLPVRAAVLSGIPMAVGRAVSPLRMGIARVLARLTPGLEIAPDFDVSSLSRDPRVVSAYREDPLVRHKLPVAVGASILDAVAEGPHCASSLEIPVLLLHGEADTLCPPPGSRAVFSALEGRGHGLKLYPNLRHEILNEPEREQVLEDARAWAEGHGL